MSEERGAVTVLGAVAAALVVALGLGAAQLAAAVGARIGASTAADGSALAAVGAAVEGIDPRRAAERVATAHGVRLESCRCPAFAGSGLVATVTVSTTTRVTGFGDLEIRVTRSAEYATSEPP